MLNYSEVGNIYKICTRYVHTRDRIRETAGCQFYSQSCLLRKGSGNALFRSQIPIGCASNNKIQV